MIYVIIQFTCIIYLAISSNLLAINYILLSLAVIVGLLAVIHMKPSNINIMPTLKDQHKLVTHGIYRYIRHPMYTSVMLLCLALTLSNLNYLSLIVMLVLIINLTLKASFEEKILILRFDSYKDYKNKTGRFIPFLISSAF